MDDKKYSTKKKICFPTCTKKVDIWDIDCILYLIKQSNVEREAELVAESDLLGQLLAEFACGGGRVSQQRLGITVHECYR